MLFIDTPNTAEEWTKMVQEAMYEKQNAKTYSQVQRLIAGTCYISVEEADKPRFFNKNGEIDLGKSSMASLAIHATRTSVDVQLAYIVKEGLCKNGCKKIIEERRDQLSDEEVRVLTSATQGVFDNKEGCLNIEFDMGKNLQASFLLGDGDVGLRISKMKLGKTCHDQEILYEPRGAGILAYQIYGLSAVRRASEIDDNNYPTFRDYLKAAEEFVSIYHADPEKAHHAMVKGYSYTL